LFQPPRARRHGLAGSYHRRAGRYAGPYQGGADADFAGRSCRGPPAGAGHLAGSLSVRASPPPASARSGAAYTGRAVMELAALADYWPFVVGLMATGVVSGIAAGLLGIGGGAIIVPALGTALLLLGFDPDIVQHVAVGTSLAIIIPTGIMSARAHHKRGAVDTKALRLWVPFIVAGTLIGGLMAGFFSGDAPRIVFAVLAFVIAANILFSFQTRLMGHLRNSANTHRGAGFVVGYLSSLMGIGGGSLTVPTLVAFGETMHKAVGTSAAIGVAIALSGT